MLLRLLEPLKVRRGSWGINKYASPEFLLLGLLQIMSESHTFVLNQFPLDLNAIHLEIINAIGIGFNSP